MVKIYRKTLRQSGRANGDATLIIISDRQSFLDANWKAVFADTLRAIEYALDVRESYPTHIDMYLGQSRALIEMEERQATSPETAPTDLLTHTKPQATMDDLVVAPTLKDEIEEVIFYCTHKTAVDEQVDPSARKSQGLFINFHGASGTGKTLAAQIIAARLGKDLLIVNYANLESELVGRTSKNIHQIFKFAIDSDCILMFDEADSFLSARISELRQSADYGINTSRSQLLKELDVYDGIVIFVTNNIANYDIAFQRRFQYNIHFPLPDLDGRYHILRKHCLSDRIAFDVDFRSLAEKMEGFSGGDIQNTVKRAVVRGMRDVLAGIADQISQPHFELGIGIVKASKEAFANKFTRSVPLHVIKPGPSRIKRRQVAVERPHR